MTSSTKNYIKNLDKSTRRKLIEIVKLEWNLPEIEYWLLNYAFVEERMRENTCRKLHISTTKYSTLLKEVLIKVESTIQQLDKIRTL